MTYVYKDDDDDLTNIKDIYISNVESHIIIGYNDDEDYMHMKFHFILLN